jgi:hypothetical protein
MKVEKVGDVEVAVMVALQVGWGGLNPPQYLVKLLWKIDESLYLEIWVGGVLSDQKP